MNNIYFKTADCAFMHLFELRFGFIDLSLIQKYAKNHKNLKQIGEISGLIESMCERDFTRAEKNMILHFANYPVKDKQESLKYHELIKKMDSRIRKYLAQ